MPSSKDTVLGKYRIAQIIGEGAYGRVYLAESLDVSGRSFTIKEMEETGLPAEEISYTRKLFRREAEMLCSLSHPVLPAVMEYFSQGGCHYIVMEYVKGATLAKEKSLLTNFVTNGFMSIGAIGPFLDSFRVGVKGFSRET
ncbi:MAG: protein kinase [Candidatus Xenobiia bacterium LiM19]